MTRFQRDVNTVDEGMKKNLKKLFQKRTRMSTEDASIDEFCEQQESDSPAMKRKKDIDQRLKFTRAQEEGGS